MKERQNYCNPTICNRTDLMTEDLVFMDKESISERCDCVNTSVCKQICDLLNAKKIDLAVNLIEWMKKSQ